VPELSRTILMVEDSPEDVEATIRALRKTRLANPVHACHSGDDALEYLYRQGRYTDPDAAPRPCMILLDLNLPGTDGRDVLMQIKNDEGLRRIPVVVLTSSSDPKDVQECYDAGANSYLAKPVDLPGFMRAIERLADYWFEIVLLPNGGGQA